MRAFKNIQCRDAVLEYDGEPQPALDDAGKAKTVWDRKSTRTDMVTGRDVPDETKRVPLLTYTNPRPAQWPPADFIVGNPPFIGTARMREDLGDGYAETLRATYPAVPESADFVLYWWHKAAELTRTGKARRFGLITTNSLTQTFARRVVQAQISATPPLSLLFAIPDHPWVDTAEGAAVRIAMTVGAAGEHFGELLEVTDEEPQPDGSAKITFDTKLGKVSADLTTGADVTATVELKSNERLTYRGVQLIGSGFIVTPDDAKGLGLGKICGLENHIRPYRNGRDINNVPRGVMVIDLFGLTEKEVREKFPAVFQHVLTTVKPERDTNNRASYREKWWIHGEPRNDLRPALVGLRRYVATVETSKHRFFQFLDAEVLPDNKLVVITLDDALFLGVLSSRVHVVYSIAAGGWIGYGNDPVYVKTDCFDPFPFPLCGEKEKTRIRELAEALDAHRKRAQDQHGLTLTGLYNVLEKLRAAEVGRITPCAPSAGSSLAGAGEDGRRPGEGHREKLNLPGESVRPVQPLLTAKEKEIHDLGLVSVLKQLHDDLDAAVFAAYGWSDLWKHHEAAQTGSIYDFKTDTVSELDATPEQLNTAVATFEQELDAEILRRLVALNATRAAEEKRGIIHYLRPDYQAKNQKRGGSQKEMVLPEGETKPRARKSAIVSRKSAWPKKMAERVQVVEAALHRHGTATPAELAAQFSRAKPADVAEILETLVTMGRARQQSGKFTR